MTEPKIQEVARKLDDVLAQIKQTKDPEVRRRLLAEVRTLMAVLDEFVLESTQSYSAKPKAS